MARMEKDLYYAHTSVLLLRLDLKDYEFNPSSAIPPFPTIAVRYSDSNRSYYPYSMGVVKSGSKIYMIGGECLIFGHPLSRKVYEFDPIKNSLTESKTTLKSIKTRPIVEALEGLWIPHLSIPLGRYHPTPFYHILSQDVNDNMVSEHFVLGHKLCVQTWSGKLFYFDTRETHWFLDTNMFKCWDGPVLDDHFPGGGRMESGDFVGVLIPDRDSD